MDRKDLEALNVGDLKWNDIDAAAISINELYAVVHGKAQAVGRWYMQKRRDQKFAAQWLRGLAAVFAASGSVIPLLALVWPNAIRSDIGYILFVAAGACLLLNRSLGISSSWIRYVTTAFHITTALEEFQLQWAQTMARLAGKPSTQEEVAELLAMLTEFTKRINKLVEDETNVWAVAFNEDLSQLEKTVISRAQTVKALKSGPAQK